MPDKPQRKNMFKEFKKFILRGNVVDLAVGIVIGAAFTSIVNSIVNGLINPLVGIIYGNHKLTDAKLVIHHGDFLYGSVINSIITFLIVAAVVFFLVVQPINKLTELSRGSKDTDEDTTRKCPFCLSEIPVAAKKCSYCTSSVKPQGSLSNN
jgi:large conductance mechanosensitive channel